MVKNNPSYIESFNNGTLKNVAEKALSMLSGCNICPRKCSTNRLKGFVGYCKTALKPKIYSYLPHFGEEPPISGGKGSGTIFFSNCNMSCIYCQNYEFSQKEEGREVDLQDLADIMLKLQELGCHNINLVTPTHIVPQILNSLLLAIPKGLNIPLVYNTSGYELPETINMLDQIIDIYLADMRYADDEQAILYSCAPDYPKFNQASIKEMHKQVGIPKINGDGIMEKGLVIRHLVLPNNISGTEKIMKFIASQVSVDTYISLMSQYSPFYKAVSINDINRKPTANEYNRAKEIMEKYGLLNGWVQDDGGLDKFAGTNIKTNFKDDQGS